MRIRVKLTIVLLICSLTPLILLKIVEGRAIRRLSTTATEQAVGAVSRRVEQELSLHADGISVRMGEKIRTVMLIVRGQARAFERIAASSAHTEGDARAADLGAVPVLTAADFEDGADVPGLRDQPGWRAGSGRVPRVTYAAPVFVPASGVSLDDPLIWAQASRLAQTAGLLAALSENDRALVRSQYVTFENGLHMAFPGKGGYPASFDGRERPWYTAGLSGEEPTWIGPVIDAVTGEARMTCSAPVHGGDGTVIGVTGVDISLQDVLATLSLPPDLALGSETLVVTTSGPRLGVIMSTHDGRSGEVGTANPKPLRASDESGLARIARDLAAGRDGVVHMERDSEPSVWAYARMGPGVGVVIIVPGARVDAMVAGVRQDLRTLWQETVRTTAAASLLVVILSFLAAYLLGRTLSRPIRRLADAAEAISAGDMEARAVIRPRRDEIGKLSRAFNRMVPALAESVRLHESLSLANELQRGLLPSEPPEIPGFEIFGISMYCDETGGDYYDYLHPLTLGEGRFGIVIGDVTGHGIPAALVMTSARALLQSHARWAGSPGEVLERVNETIATDASQGRFITLMLLMIDTKARRLTIANAGHDPGVVYRAGSGVFDETPIGDLPLGIETGERYRTSELAFPGPGDVFLLATDGVWEMRDPGNGFYGKERMRGVIRANSGASAAEIGQALLDDLEIFRATAPRRDDVTFIVVKAVGE